MNYLALLFGLLTLSLAAPTAEPPNTDSDITLEKRKSAQSCKIINVDHYVNCRYQPSLDAGEIFGLKRGTKYVFACKAKGDCYSGNCSWDQITLYGTTCYVNGYFTDSNCSSDKLPAC
ncbi:hypothetical protein BJX68DRAFT_242870 [Aspergillus pseudodeflectus]|uniref:Uncharacterized protein n=1 Tax=Aspergillus pseudodeflectus TaxID=176178 RepID=A0ABR4JXD2_9EURO